MHSFKEHHRPSMPISPHFISHVRVRGRSRASWDIMGHRTEERLAVGPLVDSANGRSQPGGLGDETPVALVCTGLHPSNVKWFMQRTKIDRYSQCMLVSLLTQENGDGLL